MRKPRVPIVEIPPTTLKKFATGSGNADKPKMLAEAIRRLAYGGSSLDEADALWLLQMGLHYYGGEGKIELPAKNYEAMAAITWPDPPYVGPDLDF